SEAAFFQTYGNVFSLYLADKHEAQAVESAAEPRELPFVKEALASIAAGGVAATRAARAETTTRRRVPRYASRLHPRRMAADPRRAGHHRPVRTQEGDCDAASAAREAGGAREVDCAVSRVAGGRTRATLRADDRATRDDPEHWCKTEGE